VRRLAYLAARELVTLWEERWFRFGFFLRILAVLVLVPRVQRDWFVPFLGGVLATPTPYQRWLESGGDAVAWPYGPAMTLAHLPTVLVGLLQMPLWVGSAVFGLTLVVFDLASMLALRHLTASPARMTVAKLWWLSPASIVISFWHGQTDVVPLALLLGGLVFLGARRFRLGGALIGLSIAAKLTMAFAPPFLLVWLALSHRYRSRALEAVAPLALIPLVGYGLLLLWPGAFQMVLGSPVVGQAASASVSLHGTPVMILPGVLIGLLYVAARARRLGFDLLVGILGAALFAMAAVLAVAPGWWLWALPFLALYASRSWRVEVVWGVWLFSSVLALETVLGASGADLAFLPPLPSISVPPVVSSASLTLVVSVGFVLAASMFRHLLADNDPYDLAKRPLLIGLSGPSGSGKDTLSSALARVFGEREVVAVSGDDYHKWERAAPMWRVFTHLNPTANRLRELTDDVIALTLGRSIQCRYYDHSSGRFEPTRSKHYNDVVLVSGLHTLYVPELRNALDVRIFLDMDERLRRFLKIGRDVEERGHDRESVEKSMALREPDLAKYIRPQADHADLVLRLEPRDAEELPQLKFGESPALRLRATIRSALKIDEVARLLAVFSFAEIEVVRTDGSGETEFRFEGDDVTGQDVLELVKLLVPHCDELLAVEPRFDGGVTGVMQLLVLMQISVVRRRTARNV
jgi:uridine kinase